MRKFPVEWKTRAKGLAGAIRLDYEQGLAGLHSPVHCRRAVVGSSCSRCVLNWHLKLAQIATGVAWNQPSHSVPRNKIKKHLTMHQPIHSKQTNVLCLPCSCCRTG